jgi:glycosyltransferase involved in cell wall biosynthesis
MSNNKPKLIAFMNVYNEAEYIEYSLKSIYDVADKIYIVEGAFWETYLTNGNKQASDDGTIDIINNFPDKDNKIIHRGAPVGMNQLQQRNWGFGCINEKDEYWL